MNELVELLGEELATTVQEKLGDTKLVIGNNGTWLPKSKFDDELKKVDLLTQEINSYKDQLGKLEVAANGNEELTMQIKQLQEQNAQVSADFENKLITERKLNAIKLDYKDQVHDLDTFVSWINLDNVQLDDSGKVVSGLTEQAESIKQSKSYIYKQQETNAVVEEESKPKVKTSIGNHVSDSNQQDDPFTAVMRKKGYL